MSRLIVSGCGFNFFTVVVYVYNCFTPRGGLMIGDQNYIPVD